MNWILAGIWRHIVTEIRFKIDLFITINRPSISNAIDELHCISLGSVMSAHAFIETSFRAWQWLTSSTCNAKSQLQRMEIRPPAEYIYQAFAVWICRLAKCNHDRPKERMKKNAKKERERNSLNKIDKHFLGEERGFSLQFHTKIKNKIHVISSWNGYE